MNRPWMIVAGLGCAGALSAQGEHLMVPTPVLDSIGAVLPERSNAGAAFLAPGFSPNLSITAAAQVRIVFAWANAGQRNALGWFTWRAVDGGIEVLDNGLLFPDTTMKPKGPLASGDARWLSNTDGSVRTFQPGERVGFFLLADGWNVRREQVTNWRRDLGVPASTAGGNGAFACFTTVPEVNPEAAADSARAAHVAMVRMPGQSGFLGGQELLLMGFEDLDRTKKSDDDFNDSVFLVDVQPSAAVDRTGISLFDPTDRDGDRVAGVEDAFPDDPDRAWVRRVPQNGYTVLAFEDYYPDGWDGDFNDAVFAFAITTILDSKNRVTDLIADYHLVGRGASWDHEFGLHVPTLPSGTRGAVRIERFDSGDVTPRQVEWRDLAAIARDGGRIDRIFASTLGALPRAVPDKPFANTWPGHPRVPAASARVWVQFTDRVRETTLGPPPFDPFLFVHRPDGKLVDVHLPGFDSLPDRSPDVPAERGPKAFLDSRGSPWAIMLPTTWRYPLEAVPISRAYPTYQLWVDSRGRVERQWYEQPTSEPDRVADPIGGLIPPRAWTLRGPGDRF